jgi:hypothetical protein
MLRPSACGIELEQVLRSRRGGAFEPPHFGRLNWGGMAPHPAFTGRIMADLFSTCYLPVTSLLSANYLPVILLFCVQRLFLTNHLKTNGFRRIIAARIAPEQGEKGG